MKSTQITPQKGLASVPLVGDSNYCARIENMVLSDTKAIEVRPGSKIVDVKNDFKYVDTFNLTIGGVECVIGIDYSTLRVFCHTEFGPSYRMPLRTYSHQDIFVDQRKAKTSQLAFLNGTRFELLETPEIYILWSNSSSSSIIIQRNGVFTRAQDVEDINDFITLTFEQWIDGAREGGNPSAVYINAEIMTFSDDDIHQNFVEMDNFYPIVGATSSIAYINESNGLVRRAEPNRFTSRKVGGAFSPLPFMDYRKLVRGDMVLHVASSGNKFYMRATDGNTLPLLSTETFDTTDEATSHLDCVVIFVDEIYDGPGPIQFGRGYYILIPSSTDGTPATALPVLSSTGVDKYALRLQVKETQAMHNPESRDPDAYNQTHWVWINPDNIQENTEFVCPVGGSQFYNIYQITNEEDLKYLLPLAPVVVFPGPTCLPANVRRFRGNVLNGRIDTREDTGIHTTPVSYLQVAKHKLHTQALVRIRENRFHDTVNIMPSGLFSAPFLVTSTISYRKETIRSEDHQLGTWEYAFDDETGDVSNWVGVGKYQKGQRLLLFDGARSVFKRGRLGFTLSGTSIDILQHPMTGSITPDQLGIGEIRRYYPPFISTKFFPVLAQDTAQVYESSFPLTLDHVHDVAISNGYLYALKGSDLLVGDSKRLTLLYQIPLTGVSKRLMPFAGGIMVFFNRGIAYYTIDGNKNVIKKYLRNT